MLKQWPGMFFLTMALLAVWIPSAAAASLQHIITAQLINIPSPGFSAPPKVIDEQQLPDMWVDVNLPHALTRQLIPSAAGQENTNAVITETWYRLQLSAPVSATQHLYLPRWKPMVIWPFMPMASWFTCHTVVCIGMVGTSR